MADSNLPAVIEGIKRQIETATRLKHVYAYEPDAPSSAPMFFFTPKRWKRIPETYGEMAIEWEFEGWAFVPSLNNENAEKQRAVLVVQIIGVSGHDLDAGESLVDGQVLIEAGEFDTVKIQGVPGLGAMFVIQATERISYDYAL